MIEYIKKYYITFIFSGLFGVLSFMTLDFSGLVVTLMGMFSMDTSNLNSILNFTSSFFKALILIELFIIYLVINVNLFSNKTLHKKYNPQKIVKEMSNIKCVYKIQIFGYSLSFIEDVRYYLDITKASDIEVEVYYPSEEYIKKYLNEDKEISYRLETLKGRIKEWNDLENNSRIKKVDYYYYNSLPIEYGIVINESIAYLSNINWYPYNSGFKLKKNPRDKRNMFKITINNEELWPFLKMHLMEKKQLSNLLDSNLK